MAADSEALLNLRANVLRILEKNDSITLSGLVRAMNVARHEKAAISGEKAKEVSRTFFHNMLHHQFDCSMGFAEEIAKAVGVPLPVLISEPKNLRQTA